MKKISLIAVISLLASVANAQIAVVDTQYIFENSNITKQANEEMMALTKQIKDDIKAQEQLLAEKQDSLAAKKSVLSTEVYEQKLEDLRKEIMEFRKGINKTQKELEVKNTQKKQEIADAISQVVESIAAEKGYDAVLSKSFLMYNKTDLEITDLVLEELNK